MPPGLANRLLLLLLLGLLLCVTSVGSASASTAHEKLQQLRHTAKQQPSNPLPHVQLAIALHELNHQIPDGGSRVPEAEKEYRQALSLIGADGEHASIYMHVQGNLGALLLSADRPAEAITEFEGALTLGRKLVQQIQQQIKQHKKKHKGKKNQQQQVLAEVQQELQEVQQQLGGTLFNLGKALTSVGRLSEADEVYSQAAVTAHGHDFGSYGKALAAMRSMGTDLAMQALQVCKSATQHLSSQSHLSFLEGIHPPTSAAEAEAETAAGKTDDLHTSPGTQPDHQTPPIWIVKANSVDLVWLYFALYKHYHHGKQTSLAWHYLQLGNRIMAAHVSYDLQKEQRNLQQIKSIFRAPFVTSGSQDSTSIFIVGMPRSGSTLVEQMLASHSQVYAAGEDTALAPLTTAINRGLANSPPADHPALLQQFAEQYLTTMRTKVATSQQQQQTSPDSASDNRDKTVPTHIVDKMLRNLWLVGYIHMLVPKACILHVVRHPMDAAMSVYAQPFGYSTTALAWAWDLTEIAAQLQMTWDIAEHWEEQLPGRVHTVFYEELVEHPESVAVQILSACGLPWEPGVLKFHDTDRSVQTASMEQVRQPLYKTSVQRWKQYKLQLEPLSEALAPLIGRYEQMLMQRLAAPAGAAQEAGRQEDSQRGAAPDAGDDTETVKDEL